MSDDNVKIVKYEIYNNTENSQNLFDIIINLPPYGEKLYILSEKMLYT